MEKFIIDNFGKLDPDMEYYFVHGDGEPLANDLTVNDLLKLLGRTKTDGIFLLARNYVKIEENGQYLNESAFVNFLQKNYCPKDTDFELRFATKYENS